MEAKIKIAVLCFDVSDIDIITVNNRLMETLKQNIDLPEKEKLRRLNEDSEYIPSLGPLNLMAHYMNELNKAFAYVSASPLSSTWYRSSTESSPSVAWYVDFSIGSAYYSDKYNSSRVRAVIDF